MVRFGRNMFRMINQILLLCFSVVLYPNRTHTSTESSSNDGRYELFCRMNEQIKEEVKTIVLQNMEGAFYSDSLIAGAMAIGLCYLNRIEKENEFKEGTTSSRILVIKGSEDNPEQYMNLMNAVFTAQKQNVVIDACILDNDSGLLQQACDITGGIYLKIPQITGLLQYLLVRLDLEIHVKVFLFLNSKLLNFLHV